MLARADPWRYILEPDPQQQGIPREMKDAIGAFKDDHLVTSLFEELVAPALSVDGFISHSFSRTSQAICRGQSEHQQGEEDMQPHGPLGLLG